MDVANVTVVVEPEATIFKQDSRVLRNQLMLYSFNTLMLSDRLMEKEKQFLLWSTNFLYHTAGHIICEIVPLKIPKRSNNASGFSRSTRVNSISKGEMSKTPAGYSCLHLQPLVNQSQKPQLHT